MLPEMAQRGSGRTFPAISRQLSACRSKGERYHECDTPRIAGLVAITSDGEPVSMARAEEFSRKQWREAFFAIHKHSNGLRSSAARPGEQRKEQSAHLRLMRSGKKVATSYSLDGKKWHELESYEVAWKSTIKVGVYARNVSEDRFTA